MAERVKERESKSVNVQERIRAIEGGPVVPYKRQKSEGTATAEQLGHVLRLSVGVEEEEVPARRHDKDRPITAVSVYVEDLTWKKSLGQRIHSVNNINISTEIEPDPRGEEEVIENNIMIQPPERGAEGIPLGVHLRKHEWGYRVHRIIREDLRQNNALREGDVIKVIGNTDVTSLPIKLVKELFWNLDFNLTITLVVLRRPEDEIDNNKGHQEYKVIATTLQLKKDDADIKFTTHVDVHTGRFMTFEPLATKFYISVKEGDDQKYLCVQHGVPKVMRMAEGSERSNFYWRTQLTLGDDLIARFILFHVDTQHTLCCDPDPTQDISLGKMSPQGFLPVGMSSEEDARWILRDPVGGETTNRVFYMKCDQHRSFFISVGVGGRLRYARDTVAHPKRKFYYHEV